MRARIVSITRHGRLETRFVVVHPTTGVVGTKAIHRFNVQLCGLAQRCVDYLAGSLELFPPPERRLNLPGFRLPDGEADLLFRPEASPDEKDAGIEAPPPKDAGEPSWGGRQGRRAVGPIHGT